MRCEIINKENFLSVPDMLAEILPYRIYDAINKLEGEKILEEIRLRREKMSYIVASGENIPLNIFLNSVEIEKAVTKLTSGSLYAHKDTIINGYISFFGGIRIGIVGRAGIDSEKIVGIYDIDELAIRIPNYIKIRAECICRLIQEDRKTHGILIYASSGVGKTTLLRAIINELSKSLRTCVVDSRGEFEFGIDEKNGFVTKLSYYPKKSGIEIAVRTMNAQVVVCDEIGDESESKAIISAHGCGVPFVASCHGSSVEEILCRPGMSLLHREHVFDHYVGIERDGKNGFSYTIMDWREANDSL